MPWTRPKDLPDYRRPPVVETVLGLQFEPVLNWTTAHAGLMAERLDNEFGRIEEHAPLQRAVEGFGPPQPPPLDVDFRISERPAANRIWLLNPDGSQLLQVQSDRLLRNWRRQGNEEQAYQHYGETRAVFMDEAQKLKQLLQEWRLGELRTDQCEISYVNHIKLHDGSDPHRCLERIFTQGSRWLPAGFLPAPEFRASQMRFVMHQQGMDAPVGRLHVTLQPAWSRGDNSPLLVFTLMARGAPLGDDLEGAFGFFDLGHDWIVKGFDELTTSEMHQEWGRTDG